MYNQFFNLSINPFGETPDTRFFFKSESHRAALEDLSWMIVQGKGFALLNGDVGTGKTLLCRMLLNILGDKANTALILHPILDASQLLEAIADEFKLPKLFGFGDNIKSRLDQLNAFLMESAMKGRKSVLIVDDAQRLSISALELIRLLSNLETERKKLLHIVFVAQPEIHETLKKHELRQLQQRIAVNPNLRNLNITEVEKYIHHRIQIAGGANFLRFQPRAVQYIFEVSQGVPRLINKYCEATLERAAKQKSRLVDLATTRDAIRSFLDPSLNPNKKWQFWKTERTANR